jgi:hypothetical protein
MAPSRTCAGAPEHAADDYNKSEDQRGGETDVGRRQAEAGRLDLEQHRRAEQEGGKAAETEYDGRSEGLDDQEGQPEQHQSEAGIVDRQQVERNIFGLCARCTSRPTMRHRG